MEGKSEGKKRSQADAPSPGGGSKTSSGGSKTTSSSESAKVVPPRKKLTFPDPVPVAATLCLRGQDQLSPKNALAIDQQAQCIRQGGEVKYSFDTILGGDAKLEDAYQDSLYPLLQAAFDGYDTCLLAFPTDTLVADATLHGMGSDGESEGLVLQLIEDIFGTIKARSGNGRQFLVEMSYLLVGGDKAYDLLCTKATKMGKALLCKPSDLDSNALVADGAVHEAVASEEVMIETYRRGRSVCMQLFENDNLLRDLGAQTLLRVNIECNEPVNGKDVYSKGCVQLVDSRADQIKHSQGLVALHNVIDSVANESNRVRWDSSQLPNMLRDVLGGFTLTRCIAIGDFKSLLSNSALELLHVARKIKSQPMRKERPDMQLRKVKEEIEALKAKFKNAKAENERARRRELQHESQTKKTALQQRLEQRKLQLQRNKEREEAEKARQAKLEEMRKAGKLLEPQVKYKIVEKEVVVEKEVEREVIEKVIIGQRDEDIAEQQRLREGATLTLEERNKLAMDGQKRDEEIRESERQKQEAERQFKALQMKVLGLASESLIGEDEDATVLDPSVIIARQQEQLRKAEYELKEQKKKEAKLKALQKKMKGAQEKTARQVKAANSEAQSYLKEQASAKQKGKATLDEISAKIRKQREGQLAESHSLAASHTKLVSEALLLETLVMQFLTRNELDQLRAISAGDEYGSFFEVPQLTKCNYDYDERLSDQDYDDESWATRAIGAAAAASPGRRNGKRDKEKDSERKDKKAIEEAEKSAKKYKKIAGKLGSEFKSMKKKIVEPTADALQSMDADKALKLVKTGIDRLNSVLKNVGYSSSSSTSNGKDKKDKKSGKSGKKDKKKRGSKNSSSRKEERDPWDEFNGTGKTLSDEEKEVFEGLGV